MVFLSLIFNKCSTFSKNRLSFTMMSNNTGFGGNFKPLQGAGRSSVVRTFAHCAVGRQIDPTWWTH